VHRTRDIDHHERDLTTFNGPPKVAMRPRSGSAPVRNLLVDDKPTAHHSNAATQPTGFLSPTEGKLVKPSSPKATGKYFLQRIRRIEPRICAPPHDKAIIVNNGVETADRLGKSKVR
jgi:hypothetical protein